MRYITHSQEILPGDCFVAFEGRHVDGHAYLCEAVAKGASKAIVRPGFATELPIDLIHIEDPLSYLQELAKEKIDKIEPLVIGITGSNGKTTTKHLLYQLLKPHVKVAASKGNQNSQLGMALSILNEVEIDTTHLILEMGMTEQGHIGNLVKIAPPHIALLLCVYQSHFAFFESEEGIARAKAEIFSHPRTRYGLIHDSFFRHKVALPHYLEYETFGASVVKRGAFDWPAHMHLNLHAALWVMDKLNISEEKIEPFLSGLTLFPHRWEKVAWEDIDIIDDAYNASPMSMKAAFQWFDHKKERRKIAILGSMGELGSISPKAHLELIRLSAATFDHILLVGEWPPGHEALYFKDKESAWEYYLTHLRQKGDLLLLKGSHFHRLWEVLKVCCSG